MTNVNYNSSAVAMGIRTSTKSDNSVIESIPVHIVNACKNVVDEVVAVQ